MSNDYLLHHPSVVCGCLMPISYHLPHSATTSSLVPRLGDIYDCVLVVQGVRVDKEPIRKIFPTIGGTKQRNWEPCYVAIWEAQIGANKDHASSAEYLVLLVQE